MSKRSGLGKGLDALFSPGETQPAAAAGVTMLAADSISPNPRQPRGRFIPEELDELAASIQEHGVIQPLIVTHSPRSGNYTLIAGERRLLAARQAGLSEVPVIIREASERQLVELALVENLQRSDLGPLETAEAYRQLAEDFQLSHESIALQVGKSRASVTNTLRLLKLPEDVQQALARGEISEGHARSLLALPTPQAQSAALHTIFKKGLNVRHTEELVRKLGGQKPEKAPRPEPQPAIKALEQRLRERLGTRVNLDHRHKGGRLVIHYYSDEELNALLELILGEER